MISREKSRVGARKHDSVPFIDSCLYSDVFCAINNQ